MTAGMTARQPSAEAVLAALFPDDVQPPLVPQREIEARIQAHPDDDLAHAVAAGRKLMAERVIALFPGAPEVIRCAQVDVDGEAVQLTFQSDLTPIETVAVFLRDAADATATGPDAVPGRDLLYAIADQLDPPAPLPAAEVAPEGVH